MIKISSFLPKYPDNNNIFDTYNNDIIYRKREFNELSLSENQSDDVRVDGLYSHQQIVSHFMSPYTLYDELFLFHFPGTGKSCTSIGTIKHVIHANESIHDIVNIHTIKKALIIVPNTELIRHFERDIIFNCGGGRYLADMPTDDEVESYTDKESRKKQLQYSRSRKLVSETYTFTTHMTFFKETLSRIDSHQDQIVSSFSNHVVVIDEIHRICTAREEIYTAFFKFLHLLENRKILLLSGTPMKNTSVEIVNVMNLILPMNRQITPDIRQILFDDKGTIRDSQLGVLESYLTGRVSYLKSRTNIEKKYIGKQIDGITFPLTVSRMSSYQDTVFSWIAQQSNTNSEAFYHTALQTSLFTFPERTYGTEGFKKYVRQRNNKTFYQSFIKRGRNVEETLRNIEQYSCKYARVIREIVSNPTQNCFVYTSSILEGGAVMFGLCLELVGFSRTISGDDIQGRRPRYAILADEVGTNTQKILSQFNRKTNTKGDFIRVLIGGRKVEEGLTFKSIQQIHIVTPRWNFSTVDQIVARGVRLGAHNLIGEGIPVRIFLHVAEPRTNESIDLKLYDISQKKDYSIKQVEHLLKKSAMDCGLTYERNKEIDALDRSRECEYTDCIYRCNDIDTLIPRTDYIEDSYNQYFFDRYRDRVIGILETEFQTHEYIYLSELDRFNISWIQLYRVLYDIIMLSVPIKNRFGVVSYLHEHNTVLFLTNEKHVPSTYTSSFYNWNPPLRPYETTNDALTSVISDPERIEMIVNIFSEFSLDKKKKTIRTLPFIVQQKFIEQSILFRDTGTPFIQWILREYGSILRDSDGYIYSPILEPLGIGRRFNKETLEWTNTDIQDTNTDTFKRLVVSEIGIFGRMDKKSNLSIINLSSVPYPPPSVSDEERNKFIEKRLDLLKTHKGKVCLSHTLVELVRICIQLQLPTPDIETFTEDTTLIEKHGFQVQPTDDIRVVSYWLQKKKSEICKRIVNYFKSNDLIV